MANMDRDVDNLFTGACITIIVGVISSVLYYMFKYAVFTPQRSTTALLDSLSSKKKLKKPESKKTKKSKKHKRPLELSDILNQDQDKAQTSEETIDDEEESVSIDNTKQNVFNNKELNSPTDDENNGEIPAPKPIPDQATTAPPNGDFLTDSMQNQPQVLATTNPLSPPLQSTFVVDSEITQTLEMSSGVSFEVISSQSAVESDPKPSSLSKRSKKRSTKRVESLQTATDQTSHAVLNLPNVEHLADAFEEVTKSGCSRSGRTERSSNCSSGVASFGESQEELGKITEQLRASERKLVEIAKQASHLSEENERLRAREEEQSLALNVLQNEYRELLRSNKTIEHDRKLKETKLKGLEAERDTLRARLEQANAETGRLRSEAEREMRVLRDQLKDEQAKLTAAMTSAAAPPPGPSAELVRAQEMTQAVSSENCLLKSRLEQLEAELGQLRKANVIQQQELQAFRVETQKLHAEKETALEELRNQRQTDKAESNSRISNYEAQLQHQHQELELERKRGQELMLKLTESRNELSHRLEHEKQQSEIISSLNYQFQEIHAQNRRLFEEATNSKAVNESAVNELRAQVASLTNDLMRTNAELHAAQLRADSLANELESLRADAAASTTTAPPCTTEHVDAGVCTDTATAPPVNEQLCETAQRKQQQPSSGPDAYESEKTVQQLREQLATVEKDYHNMTRDLDEARQRQQTATVELEHYKTTLVETEGLLAKLQDFALEAERKWRLLLTSSEAERTQLEARLAEAHNETAEVTEKLNEAERKLARQTKATAHAAPLTGSKKKSGRKQDSKPARHPPACDDATTAKSSSATDAPGSEPSALQLVHPTVVVSPTCLDEPVVSEPFERDSTPAKLPGAQHPDGPQSSVKGLATTDSGFAPIRQPATERTPTSFECQEVETSELLIPVDTDTDYDFDAVLVDDTDLHVPDDIWDSASKYSENIPADSHCDAPPLPVDRTALSSITVCDQQQQPSNDAGDS